MKKGLKIQAEAGHAVRDVCLVYARHAYDVAEDVVITGDLRPHYQAKKSIKVFDDIEYLKQGNQCQAVDEGVFVDSHAVRYAFEPN